MSDPAPGAERPTPLRFLSLVNGYQTSALLRAALELGLFTAVGRAGAGGATAEALAAACGAAARGVRILADALVVHGFLAKAAGAYRLAPEAAAFLDAASPAYLGGTVEFLLADTLLEQFRGLTEAVRRGGTADPRGGTTAAENPVWVKFARGMRPLMEPTAHLVVDHLAARGWLADPARPRRVLDVAAGHGMFGLTLARRAPGVQVVALDWPQVLQVTRENAAAWGLGARLTTIEGDAFRVDLGAEYDLVLLPNFLHHFDRPACVAFLRRARAALRPGGLLLTVELVPDEDRTSPPPAATFALVMLATTPAGDAYTFAELADMAGEAGFGPSQLHELPGTPQRLVVTQG